MNFHTFLSTEQRQTLSANQLHSLEILACTNQELDSFLTKEYLENPMLESSVNKENKLLADVESIYEKNKSYRDYYLEEDSSVEKRRSDIPAKPDLQFKNLLLYQLHQNDYSNRQWACMEYLIDCLDSDGYFTMELSELSHASAVSGLHFKTEELQTALSCLKTLEPAGIFSQSLSECLLAQLKKKEIKDDTLFLLIEEHLEELMKGHLSTISRKLKLPTVQIKSYLYEISLLNPRPVMSAEDDEINYILPDIIVTKSNQLWDISINDSWMGKYSLNNYYIEMMQKTEDACLHQYFKEKLERARFILNSIEQRKATLIQIVSFLLDYQNAYLEGGGSLKPLKQEQLADALGISVSTVSRAVRGKYLQYKKTILIKSLFSAPVSSCKKENQISSSAVKEKLFQLIQQEEQVLSDQKLAELLADSGIQISRRAVAKYRTELGIPDSRERRQLKFLTS